jgi:hypothetical protein
VIALRSAVFGAVTVGLTVLAHAAAGGGVPSPVAVALLVVVTSAVGAPMFRRRLRTRTLVPVVGVAQVALHPVFQGLADTAADAHAGHGSALPMLVAHVVAGVLAVLLVTALDPVMRCLGLRGARMPVRLGVVRVAPAAQSPVVPFGDDVVLTPRVMALPAPRRGPPPHAFFAAV